MAIDFSNIEFDREEPGEPLVTTSLTREDEGEYSLRPKTLREYIGQEKAKGNLEVFIQAAKMRHEPLDHVLLHGPPGLGKTTLSGIIANEMGGATTRAGQLSAPLRDRFGVTLRLELYTPAELALIVTRSAGILEVPIEADGAMEIARRSRGTPRIANRMLRRVRDFAQVRAGGVITKKVADEALTALEIDYLGLDSIDHRMLRSIIENYRGGPVGLDTLAATINEEAVTLEDVYEPYLMQLGFLTRTPRGRCVTEKAYRHLGLPVAGAAAVDQMDQLTF